MNPNGNPLSRLFGSSKAIIMLATAAGCFALVGLGKVTWEQAEKFLTVTVPAWMLAVGIEDAAKHMSGKSDAVKKAVAEEVKKSLPPTPPTA